MRSHIAAGTVAIALTVPSLMANRAADAASSPRPSTYTNHRYGYRALVPAGFAKDAAHGDEDGQGFHSSDRRAHYAVDAVNNALSMTPAQDLEALKANYRTQHVRVSYTSVNHDVIALSGTAGSRIYYERDLVGADTIYAIAWYYPRSAAKTYDPLVTATVKQFKPGRL